MFTPLVLAIAILLAEKRTGKGVMSQDALGLSSTRGLIGRD